MTLLDDGWSAEQAQALLDKLNLNEGIPDWKPEHLERFQKWCSVEDRDKNTIDSQIEFIAHDLCNSYETIGLALKLARTLEEAKAAVEPYVSSLREESDWPQTYQRRI